jgi:hypothetical protein
MYSNGTLNSQWEEGLAAADVTDRKPRPIGTREVMPYSGFLLPAVAGELIGRAQIIRATDC